MQGKTCICVVLLVLLATWGSVQGVTHDKVAHNSRLSKLRKMSVQNHAVKAHTNTVTTSSRAGASTKRSATQPSTTTLIQTKTKSSIKVKADPAAQDPQVQAMLTDVDSWATSPTEVTATPLMDQPSKELPDTATPAQILQAYTDIEARVDDLESGQRDAVWNRADIATAQKQALRIVQSAQEAVANEQAQHALMSIEVASKKTDKVETAKTDTQAADTKASTEASSEAEAETTTESEVEEDPACCGNANDQVARAGNAANQQSLSDMQAQVKALTDEITKAAAPPNVDPNAMNEENAAIVGDSGTSGGGDNGGGPMPSTGSEAQCNGHLKSVTLSGDPDIWKEEEQAKKDALDKLLQKVEPQFTTGMATDAETFTKTRDLMTENDAKSKDFKTTLAKQCAEPTCELGPGGGLVVEPDTS